MELFVGSYTSEDSHGAGISALALGPEGLLGAPALLAEQSNPSFLIRSGDLIYAVLEGEVGRVVALRARANQPHAELIGRSELTGADPCHLVLLPDGRVVVTNYGSGTVCLLGPAPGLELLDTVRLSGSGPVAERQEGPHAHQATLTSRGTVLVSDLGADRLIEFKVLGDSLIEQSSFRLPAGTGPRHLAFRAGAAVAHLLVVGELDGKLHVLEGEPGAAIGEWRHRGAVPLCSWQVEGKSYPAHIELSANRAKAYLSIRGQDQLSVLELSGMDDGGLPELVQEVSSGGSWPRHFALGDGLLYVANQFGDNIVVFRLRDDGLIGERLQEVEIGTPSCLLIG
ncbi:6-phosphogluconolactonase [Psychromicrobium silvestre]|uniref:6-phosphogluconolactonase n=1 Tax=Psychromicrobium silvestre TaxID=1645614 RepID=A0A7Y9LVZ0_9MICC|nr:6-phosphogluconolactonase [Psychromicrobium silvestre]